MPFADRTVLPVDDGLATGFSPRGSVEVVTRRGARLGQPPPRYPQPRRRHRARCTRRLVTSPAPTPRFGRHGPVDTVVALAADGFA